MSTEEAAQRAKTVTTATETAARNAAQAAAHEKTMLEARVPELERDLGTATTDLTNVGREFSQVTNQLRLARRRRRSCVRATLSYCRILMVSRVVTFFLCFARCLLLVAF
jgi:cytochrome c-type biogenesis protein CcmH/NrfG